MNKCLNVIGIVLALLLFPYCGGREVQPSKGKDNNAHAALAEMDSLMWRRADSAFAVLQEFVVGPEAEERQPCRPLQDTVCSSGPSQSF